MKRHLCNTSDSLEIQKLFKLDISVTGSNFFDVTGNEKFSFFFTNLCSVYIFSEIYVLMRTKKFSLA